MIPRITAFTASDIMLWSVLTGKGAFFSPIRPGAAIAKKRQNTIVSRVCLASVQIRMTGLRVPQAAILPQGFHVHALSSPILSAFALHSPGAGRTWPRPAPGGRAGLGAARGVSRAQSRGYHAGVDGRRLSADSGRWDHRRISRRDARPGGGRAAAVAGLDGRARRGAPADGVVQ